MRGVPADYYQRLHEVEERHWWAAGMRRISAALLADRMGGALLDAGCGTGGFLRFASGPFERLCGTDISPEAIELARRVVPAADLRVAPLHRLPFADEEFDVAVLNDVLQHVHEDELEASLQELRRVLRPGGTLLVRTNGARQGRRARADWRLYDPASLRQELERGGFRVERVTHANAALSAAGGRPEPPSEGSCGIPRRAGRVANAVGTLALAVEARFLGRGGRLPYGHTLFALARPG